VKRELIHEHFLDSLAERKAVIESELACIDAALGVASDFMAGSAHRSKPAESLRRSVRRIQKAQSVAKPTWREALGTIKDDEISREATRLGAEWRAAEKARE
jgi:hypothetical protein